MLPRVADAAAYERHLADETTWRDAVEDIRARHGLGDAPAERQPASFVVYRIGEVIAKLVCPLWRAQFEAERAALPLARAALGAIVPEPLAFGEVDGWPYVLTSRRPGVPLATRWPTLPSAARLRVLRALGCVIAALHGTPIAAFAGAHADWRAFVASERVACVARQRAWGLGPSLCDAITDAVDEGIARAGDRPLVLLHADLTPDNILIDDELAITGVIDFGDARLGAPAYDLVTPSLFLCRGDAAGLAALVEGTGRSVEDLGHGLRQELLGWSLLHPYNRMTRFLDVAPASRSLGELALRVWPDAR